MAPWAECREQHSGTEVMAAGPHCRGQHTPDLCPQGGQGTWGTAHFCSTAEGSHSQRGAGDAEPPPARTSSPPAVLLITDSSNRAQSQMPGEVSGLPCSQAREQTGLLAAAGTGRGCTARTLSSLSPTVPGTPPALQGAPTQSWGQQSHGAATAASTAHRTLALLISAYQQHGAGSGAVVPGAGWVPGPDKAASSTCLRGFSHVSFKS